MPIARDASRLSVTQLVGCDRGPVKERLAVSSARQLRLVADAHGEDVHRR